MERRKKVKNVEIKDKEKVKKKITFKTYIKDFLLFIEKHIWKKTKILLIIAVLLIALNVKSANTNVDSITNEYLGQASFIGRIEILAVTVIAGMIPYFYAPIIGFVGGVLNDIMVIVYAVKNTGILALLLGIIPLILNVLVLSIVSALGIYICRMVTLSYRLSNLKNMNSMNFRIKLYEMLNKKDKVKELEDKKNSKIKKVEAEYEKINYLQILNISVVCIVLQCISSLLIKIII